MMNVDDLARCKSEVRAFLDNGLYRPAYDLVTRLLEQYPASCDLLVYRARLIQLLPDELPGDPVLEDVPTTLDLARQASSTAVDPLLELGYFEYAVLNDPRAALRSFESAEQSALEGIEQALIGRAKCLVDIGNVEQARTVVKKLKTLFPDELAGPIFDLEVQLSTVSGFDNPNDSLTCHDSQS